MATIRPVAAQAQIKFLKIARSDLVARAAVRGEAAELRTRLEQTGSIAFDVDVGVFDASGAEVAEVVVNWHISQRQRTPSGQRAADPTP